MSDKSFQLNPDTTAMVTGASRGIGLAIARELSAAGARVICAGRDIERLDDVSRKLKGDSHALGIDVSDPVAVSSFVQQLPSDYQNIDILINNAGHDVGGGPLFYDGAINDWDEIINTNVNGLMRITHAVLPGMIDRGFGHVINIGSIAGFTAYRTGAAYAASKFAVHGFSESLRKDCADTDIKVTEILPGLVKTDFAQNRHKGDREKAERYYARFAAYLSSEDVAQAVLYVLQQPANVLISQLVIEPNRTLRPE